MTHMRLTIRLTFLILVISLLSTLAFAEKGGDSDEGESKEFNIETYSLKAGESFSCKRDISYSWKVEEDSNENSVFFTKLVERSSNLKIANELVESRTQRAREEALNKCRELHSIPRCTGKALLAAESQMREMDFQTRRTLRASITAECEERKGICTKSEASNIQCTIFHSPDTKAENTESSAEGKDKK